MKHCIIALAVLLAAVSPAGAVTICGEKTSIVEQLRQVHGERRRVEAVTAAGALLEAFVSPAGTWSIVVTMPGGPSCLVGAGEGWQAIYPQRLKI